MATSGGYKQEKRCCMPCDARKLCHVCENQTLYACSDCRIDFGVTIYVCPKCQGQHEQKCSARLREQMGYRQAETVESIKSLCNQIASLKIGRRLLRDALEEIKTTLNHRGSYGPEDEAWDIAHNAIAKDNDLPTDPKSEERCEKCGNPESMHDPVHGSCPGQHPDLK